MTIEHLDAQRRKATPNMDRIVIPEKELIDKINAAFAAHEETAGCRISGIFKLPEPDDKGCNWSIDFISTGGTPKEFFLPLADKIIEELQNTYNVKQ